MRAILAVCKKKCLTEALAAPLNPAPSVTPENAFKWPRYEPQRGNYTPGAALLRREYVQWARARGMPVRGHTLVRLVFAGAAFVC
jgi:GH35 family endo-1,4-beta-xylanase